MADGASWRYYGAVFASLISTLAWLGALAVGGYLLYGFVADGVVRDPVAGATVALVVLGIAFAQVEKRLYVWKRRS